MFDLGNLLVGFRGVEAIGEWLGEGESAALWERWLASPAVRAFERGREDAGSFARSLVAELDLPLDPGEVLDQIAGWITGPTPGAVELLDELRELGEGRPSVACLSNTNPVHWPLLHESLGDRFDHLFLSHRTGLVKPDPAAFDQVPAALGLPASRVLFFDDQPTNVRAARARGLAAEQATSPADCRRLLVARGVLRERGLAGTYSPLGTAP